MYKINKDRYCKEHNRLVYPSPEYDTLIINKKDLTRCHLNFYDLKVFVVKELRKIKDKAQKPKLEGVKMLNPFYTYKYLTAKPVEYIMHVTMRIYDVKGKCFRFEIRNFFCLEEKDIINNKPSEDVMKEILKTMFGEYFSTTLMNAENVSDDNLKYSARIESNKFDDNPYTITLKNVGETEKPFYHMEFKRKNSKVGKTTLKFASKEYLTNTMKSIADAIYT